MTVSPFEETGTNASNAEPSIEEGKQLKFVSPEEHFSNRSEGLDSDSVHSKPDGLQEWAAIVRSKLSQKSCETNIEQIERIRIMHDRFVEGASFSFNYNTLLFVACVVAGLGLVANSTASVIAAMLVSPLMGPVVGMGYGSSIGDWKLVKKSLKTEIISLTFCLFCGVVIGLIVAPSPISHSSNYPTSEMMGRGTWSNLVIGLPIAFVSGLGVAVGLLDEQTNSLVGVAISASLLPPAVDAGLLWTAAAIDKLNGKYEGNSELLVQYGGISLLLSVANIILIWASTMFMFRLKEVLPIEKSIFWDDIGVARLIYRNRATMMPEKEEDTKKCDDWVSQSRLDRLKYSMRQSASVRRPNQSGIFKSLVMGTTSPHSGGIRHSFFRDFADKDDAAFMGGSTVVPVSHEGQKMSVVMEEEASENANDENV